MPPDIATACGTSNPYLVTACYFPPLDNVPYRYEQAPALVAFRDTPQDEPLYRLARQPEVGAVWGLAYSGPEHAVYAAAFHKRRSPFGPGGPGAIYRVDLASGTVTHLATIPNAGPDRHARGRGTDILGRDWAGKTSLGDLDLSDDASELLVVNLNDRRIYRLALPSGQIIGSFTHGASGAAWAAEARPFGLKVHRGRVYHGVMHSAERSRQANDLAGHVYSSLADGTDMREVVAFPLRYPRGVVDFDKINPGVGQGDRARLDWRPWATGFNSLIEPRPDYPAPAVYPMPILADIDFDAAGDMILGLRDRQVDVTNQSFPLVMDEGEVAGMGFGDILVARAGLDGWTVQVDPEPYDDRGSQVGDESSQGGVAALNWLDQVVAAASGFNSGKNSGSNRSFEPGVFWYHNASGNKVRSEIVCGILQASADLAAAARSPGAPPLGIDDDSAFPPATLGDIEVLCAPTAAPSPTATPTDTPPPTPTLPTTSTPSPSATVTSLPTLTSTPISIATSTSSPTPTPTKPPPIYLPITLREPPCDRVKPRVDVILVLDASTSMLEPTRAGRTKLAAAQEAARLFLEQLDLAAAAAPPSTRDQAAVVGFNAAAWLAQPLTGDRSALRRALDGLAVAQFTRIDLGIRTAHAEIAGPRHAPGRDAAMIVLTDGRNNPEPVASAVAAAAEAKAGGIRLFTIGLGDDVETAALAAMASNPGDFYAAPDGEDLAAIYRAIAGAFVPCPAAGWWPHGR